MQHQVFPVQSRQEEDAVFLQWGLGIGLSAVATSLSKTFLRLLVLVHEFSSALPDGNCVQEGLHL